MPVVIEATAAMPILPSLQRLVLPGGHAERDFRRAARSTVRYSLLLGAALVTSMWLSADAHGRRSDYVGAHTCRKCHESAYMTWQKSAHARADTSIGSAPQPACLACHTTGEAPASRPYLAAVQCEACHGPGAGYAEADIMRDRSLAVRLGLRDLSTPDKRAALCATCHDDRTRLTPFDPERAFQRIRHESP